MYPMSYNDLEVLEALEPFPPTPPPLPSLVLLYQAVIFMWTRWSRRLWPHGPREAAPWALFAAPVGPLAPGASPRIKRPGRGPQRPAPMPTPSSPSDLLLGHVPAGGARLSALL